MVEEKSTALLEIQKAKEEGANLLLPSTNMQGLSEFHAPVVDSVFLSPNPQDGDVYPDGSGENSKLRLAAQGLRKLSVCAGIIWHPGECRRTDNRQDRNYVSYQAVGGIKKTDGTPVWWKGEYDLDFEVIEEEIREGHINKSKHWRKPDDEKQTYVESSTKRDLLFKRKHKIKLAETGAANRVIRAILGLKASYTKVELSKPFVMVRIIFKPDYSDPEVKRQITQAAIQSMTGVYGNSSASSLIQEVPPIDLPPEDYHVAPDQDHVAGSEANKNSDPEQPKPNPEPDLDFEFKNADVKSQITMLTLLAGDKGYDLSTLKKPLKDFSINQKIAFRDKLEEMPDIANLDKVPF